MNRLIYIGLGLIILAYINNITALLAAVIFPILFLFFLHKIDVFERDELKDIFYVFIFGTVASFFISEFIYVPIRDYMVPGNNNCLDLFTCFLSVGLPEEIVKIIPFVIVLKYRSFVDEPIDYLIYASASALGFVFVENIYYILQGTNSGSIVAVRSFLPLIMHIVSSSIFAFGIFLYVNSKKTKFILFGLMFAALTHSIYNWSWIFGELIGSAVLILLCVYYSKLLQSLLNISPFYDNSKEKDINSASNFLLYIIISVLILDFIYDIYYNGIAGISINPKSYIIILAIAFAIYRIISSRLSLKKANFIALGSRKTKFKTIIEMQDIVINFYKNNRNK